MFAIPRSFSSQKPCCQGFPVHLPKLLTQVDQLCQSIWSICHESVTLGVPWGGALGHSSVHIRELHLESSDILVLRHGCVIKSGTRGENIACLRLRLLYQPWENTAVLHFLLHNGSHCQAGTHGLITFIISVTYCLSEMLGSSDPQGLKCQCM